MTDPRSSQGQAGGSHRAEDQRRKKAPTQYLGRRSKKVHAGAGRNIHPGQRTISIHVLQSATKDKDPRNQNSSSEHTEAQTLALNKIYERSHEEKEASCKIDSNIITSNGTSIKKQEHLDSSHKIGMHLVSRDPAVSVRRTISQSN